MIDALDQAAGLAADDEIFTARRFRPEFVTGAEQCRQSVLSPEDDLGLSPALRVALARRMVALNADQPLLDDYDAQLSRLSPDADLLALARGESELAEPLAALARHADFITLTPAGATLSDITRLQQAGLSSAQIVAISELIAFVNFQTRVAAGLRLMRLA